MSPGDTKRILLGSVLEVLEVSVVFSIASMKSKVAENPLSKHTQSQYDKI